MPHGPLARGRRRVCAVFLGAQAIRFVKQCPDLGLKGKLPLISSGIMTDEHVLRSMGDEALGIISALQWSPTLKGKLENKEAFVAALKHANRDHARPARPDQAR